MLEQVRPSFAGSAGSVDVYTVLIAEPQPIFRHGLLTLLDTTPDLEVIGQVSSRQQLVADLRRLSPDLLVIEPDLAGGGPELLQSICESRPKLRVLVLTGRCNDLGVIESVRAGVTGFLNKSAPVDTVLQAMRAVVQGQHFLDPSVTSAVIGEIGRNRERRRTQRRRLTQRERAVLSLLVEGRRNKEISLVLSISERTVKFHLRALYQKLRVSNRTEAVMAAVHQGLVSPSLTGDGAPGQREPRRRAMGAPRELDRSTGMLAAHSARSKGQVET